MLDVRFARSGDVSVAYHVVGDGPIDLVYVAGAYTHLEVDWELAAFRAYVERLAEFCRVILFDKRGMGMSDRVPGATSLEVRMDDIRAVMDAVGSDRASLVGESEGGPLSILFAAAHPERTHSLILAGAEVRERTDEDWPWGESTREEFEASMVGMHERWGEGRSFQWLVTGQREPVRPERALVTILFVDLVASTETAARLGDRRWRELLDAFRTSVRRELGRYRGSEVDWAGDGLLATFDGPARAIRCGRAIEAAAGSLGMAARAGIHTGEVEVLDGRVAGIAVHIGARVAALADAGEVWVSGTVHDLVAGSGLAFEDRGAHTLKGVPGDWRLFRVAG